MRNIIISMINIVININNTFINIIPINIDNNNNNNNSHDEKIINILVVVTFICIRGGLGQHIVFWYIYHNYKNFLYFYKMIWATQTTNSILIYLSQL